MIKQYTRDQLIDICEQAIVDCSQWSDRDSLAAQINIGTAWALLMANVPFVVLTEDNDGDLVTDDHIIWIRFKDIPGFGAFEGGNTETEICYLPTPQRLDIHGTTDWY